MTQIDLKDYAQFSSKIPSPLLRDQDFSPSHIPFWKIMAGYGIDLYAVTTMMFSVALFYQLSVGHLILTESLKSSFDRIPFTQLSLGTTPIVLFSYFFFSYFFNQGQTLGMWKFKNRISMGPQSFTTSFKWALYSSGMIFSMGLIYPLMKNWSNGTGREKVRPHDYLYLEMMSEKILHSVNLVELVPDANSVQEIEIERLAA